MASVCATRSSSAAACRHSRITVQSSDAAAGPDELLNAFEGRSISPYPCFVSGEPSSAFIERWQSTYPIIFSPVRAEGRTDRLQRVLSTYLLRYNQLAQRLGIEPISEGESGDRITVRLKPG